jgi:DNA-binding NtrC family response regulator
MSKKRCSILVADDDRLARWAAKERLSEQPNLLIDETDSAEEALAKVAAGHYDLVLLDIGFAGMGGVEALSRLLELKPALKVIMLTAEDSESITLECLKRGAFDYLCKPINLDAIEAAVLRAVAPLLASGERGAAGAGAEYLQRFVGSSSASRRIREQIRRITASRVSTVLIQGESGTGKEVIAAAIHAGSDAPGPFITVNCAAVPSGLLESELFGHETGAFTDAKGQKKGLFELANRGTILLDEIGDMDLTLQAKLLRVIEQRNFRRVGGTADIAIEVRIIAATNADLAKAVAEGALRKDLFYRLNVIPVFVPPLRERREDIPPLVAHFVDQLNHELEVAVKSVSAGAMSLLCRYSWPGNARQLKNVLERIMVVETSDTVLVDHLPPEIRETEPAVDGPSFAVEAEEPPPVAIQLPPEGLSLESVERELIRQALLRAEGNITRASALVGLHRDTLRYRARKFGLISE